MRRKSSAGWLRGVCLRRRERPVVVERNESDLEALAGHREGRANIASIEYGDGVFITGEGDDRVFAAVQRHAVQLRHHFVLIASRGRLEAIRMRADGETLKVVGGTVHANDHVDRL